MDSAAILSRNHDLHMHSLEFSDGRHPAMDVARYAARWQEPPRWVGLSDHSPQTGEMLSAYVQGLSGARQQLLGEDGITLLTGMELEWGADGMAVKTLPLDVLDYVLAGYHAAAFTSPPQVERYFDLIAQHPFTDVAAHPDWFLGKVDTLAVRWEQVFNTLQSHAVLCEYNLTTPLHPEIFEIARTKTDVAFTIGSDTHYFYNPAYVRIINAWSESVGGGYEVSRDYLVNLLRVACSQEQTDRLAATFDTAQRLEDFQKKIFRFTLNAHPRNLTLEPEEGEVVRVLEGIPEGELDRQFQARRLERFTALPPERIVSLLSVQEFKAKIADGRKLRAG